MPGLEKLNNAKTASVLVVGDVMLDHYIMGTTSRISPEAPVPIVKVQKEHSVPGGAGNVALNIAAMKSKVMLMGLIGKDDAGIKIEKLLAGCQVDVCFEKTDFPTITKSRVISHHQQMLRLDHEESFNSVNKESLIQDFEKKLLNYSVVILSDYGKGTLSDPQEFIKKARAKNIPVLVDPKGSDFSKYQHATVITPNFSEFTAVVGACQTEEEIILKAQNLIKKLDLKALLITRSADGMTLVFPEGSKDSFVSIPTEAHEVFDVTGAGDTVIAHFALAVGEGHDFVSAMKIANRAAGIVVGKLGAATVTREELVQKELVQKEFHSAMVLKMGVLTEQEASQEVFKAKKQGAIVVFTNGCFDLLHTGHLTYLEEAKALGDYLIVAVNTDESVQKLKGPTRPIRSVKERMEMLAALKCVDWVVSFPDDTPERILRLICPDVLVKGGDYVREMIPGYEFVSSYGGKILIVSLVPGVSTTKIIEKIKN